MAFFYRPFVSPSGSAVPLHPAVYSSQALPGPPDADDTARDLRATQAAKRAQRRVLVGVFGAHSRLSFVLVLIGRS